MGNVVNNNRIDASASGRKSLGRHRGSVRSVVVDLDDRPNIWVIVEPYKEAEGMSLSDNADDAGPERHGLGN